MTNEFETLFSSEFERRQWFRRAVAELGAMLSRLPGSRRDKALKMPADADGERSGLKENRLPYSN